MDTPALAYAVRDRSILLPFYKRWLVEPLLPLLPARLDPNLITHAGHLLNGVLVAAASLAALAAYRTVGGHGGAAVDGITTALALSCFGALTIVHAVRGHRAVAALDLTRAIPDLSRS